MVLKSAFCRSFLEEALKARHVACRLTSVLKIDAAQTSMYHALVTFNREALRADSEHVVEFGGYLGEEGSSTLLITYALLDQSLKKPLRCAGF